METHLHSVFLHDVLVGHLVQQGLNSRFVFDENYWGLPSRPVLGMVFEDRPGYSPQATKRLPKWFSNLLPEGTLRRLFANGLDSRGNEELTLLLAMGNDLPGAVKIVPDADNKSDLGLGPILDETSPRETLVDKFKFSLAGMAMKMSLLRTGRGLTLPASNQLGDWIIKFPMLEFPSVPINEYQMMRLAKSVGINIPEIDLIHRDELPKFPDSFWPRGELVAYTIKRFDRNGNGGRIHMEDLAQVRDLYPEEKYYGSFETVGSLVHRGYDTESYLEFVRRLVFYVLIGNGDAHLKNWSFLYPDRQKPVLSPAYDIVSTGYYLQLRGENENLGLKLNKGKSFTGVHRASFERMSFKIGVPVDLTLGEIDRVVHKFEEGWEQTKAEGGLPEGVVEWIENRKTRTVERLLGKKLG